MKFVIVLILFNANGEMPEKPRYYPQPNMAICLEQAKVANGICRAAPIDKTPAHPVGWDF